MNAYPDFWLLDDGPLDPALNMARDDVLLAQGDDVPGSCLRFYCWSEPAATFGYFQKYRQIEAMTSLRPLVRRPTGGGLVPHDGDWTYSLAFAPYHPWYQLSAAESYLQLHGWLQAALRRIGVETTMAAQACKTASGQCFAGPEISDLTWNNRKIAGAAQRRSRTGLLIQGSLQPPAGIDRRDWLAAMRQEATTLWGVGFSNMTPGKAFERCATRLAREKYGNQAYNMRR